MQYTLSPECFLQEFQKMAEILEGPLRIAGQVILNPDFSEIKKSIEKDQKKLSENRAAERNCEFKGSKSENWTYPK